MSRASGRLSVLGRTLAHDVSASLVVFLVAVPLALGIALASNAPVLAGLIGAAVGGIVVGSLSGAPLQVSGPAAGLTVTIFGLVERFGGDWRAVCAIVVAAGALQVALGALRIARVALAISPAVIHGMLAGIGVLIALGQLHMLLGGTPQSSAWKNLGELPDQIADLHGATTLLGILALAILVVWPLLPARRLRAVPAPLVAVVVATLAALALDADGVERIDLSAPAVLSAIRWPAVPDAPAATIIAAVVGLALVASVESLLSAVAVDKLHDGPRANLDRELVAQGIGNMLSGLLGGLPVTGVIVRSSANVQAGARTRLSTILHGAWVLLLVTQLGWVVEHVPKSVLAALLVYVGGRLVDVRHIRDLARHGELPVYAVTVAGVVGLDLLSGVGLGIGTAVLLLLLRLARMRVEVEHRGARWHVQVFGSLTFLGVPRLSAALHSIPPGATVDVDLEVDFVDHAGLDALHGWRKSYERAGGRVDIDEVHEAWAQGASALRPGGA